MAEKRIKVLLVDDEAQFRATTQKILERRGFNVIQAADGAQALQKINERPDVVILDIRMPGMDGLEALAALKKAAPKTPVIMLTGHGSDVAAGQAHQSGAFDFLSKPCDIELLASKIIEAYRADGDPQKVDESLVRDVMVPLDVYTTLRADATVAQAIDALRKSFSCRPAGDSIMETGHRSVLVMGDDGKAKGMLSIEDLLRGMMPAYLSAPKPTTADAIQYSPMFWRGNFSLALKKMADLPIGKLMSPAPPHVDAEASLLEAAYALLQTGQRRLAVTDGDDKLIGVLREQDLFFEMERLLGS